MLLICVLWFRLGDLILQAPHSGKSVVGANTSVTRTWISLDFTKILCLHTNVLTTLLLRSRDVEIILPDDFRMKPSFIKELYESLVRNKHV